MMITKIYNKLILIFFLAFSSNIVLANNLTAPTTPELKAIAWDGLIILTWDKIAEESIDGKTGYADFEGYRLYKSTDGGQTWGQPIPVGGEVVGYQPVFQTDLTEDQDTTRCVYSNTYYSNNNQCEERDIIISGPDPVAPWFNLGNNAFLEHSYYDYDVINGIEYTYAITAYDMGLRIGNTEYINCTYFDPQDGLPYSEFECEALTNQNTGDPYCSWDASADVPCNWINPPSGDSEAIIDTMWQRTGNPGKFTCPDGWMCPSFESPRNSETFTDYNANGARDIIEDFFDSNGNGQYDYAEDFVDYNNNGVWDNGICQGGGTCSNSNFLNEESCEGAGHDWEEIDNETDCINNFYCSDNVSLDQESCENSGPYCFNLSNEVMDDYADEESCEAAGECPNLEYTTEQECNNAGVCTDADGNIIENVNEEACNDLDGEWFDYNYFWIDYEYEWDTYEWRSYVWIDEEEYDDLNDNGQYDAAEGFIDSNNNGIWDSIDEPFIDCGFVDCNAIDGDMICKYDTGEDGNSLWNDEWKEGQCSDSDYLTEAECCVNGCEEDDNNTWGESTVQSIWICEESPHWYSENLVDENGNCEWDDGELFTDSNDNNIYDSIGNGCWDEDREFKINVVSIIPSINAIDITYPTDENIDQFFIANDSNIGTGKAGDEIFLKLVDEADLDDYIVKMEIQAEGTDDDFEGFKTRNPFLYVYRVDSMDTQRLVEGFYSSVNISDLDDNQIADYLDMPGATYSNDNSQIFIPTYEIDPHEIMFSDESGAESNFTQWFSGIQLRFDNYWFELPQTNSFAGISNIDYMNITDTVLTDYMADENENGVLDNFEDDDDSNDLGLPWALGEFDVPGQWWTNSGGSISLSYWGGSFDDRPMFDYKIEFSAISSPDTSYRVFPSSSEDYCVDVSLNNSNWDGNKDEVSLLPFKVTNLTTGRQVRSWHNDKGIYTGDGAPQSDDPGYGDCQWNPNEILSFTHDSLAVSDDLDDVDDEKSFELIVNYTIQALRVMYGQETGFDSFEEWAGNLEQEYPITSIVEYNETLWQATETINQYTIYPDDCSPCAPNAIYDMDGDNINDNPWQQLYPWQDGDYIIVTPDKWYQDGDSWVADLTKLGEQNPDLVTENSLDDIYVKPNPYIVNTSYDGDHLKFMMLPSQCEISIYTITGELVDKMSHNSDMGEHAWYLTNQNGDKVVPGLYIFVIESGNLEPRIGKFVIIR